MTMAAKSLIEQYQMFTKESLKWCIDESESSTARVSAAIDVLLKDAARVSELSQESLEAINGVKDKLQVHIGDESRCESVNDLIKALVQLASENDEVQNVIHPIISSLQFQDRLRQNLENLEKMIPAWLNARQNFSNGLTAEQLTGFGEEILKLTTMKEERDRVKEFISGLPEEEAQDSVLMF